MRTKQARPLSRKTLTLLALALLLVTIAMLFSMYRSEPLKEFLMAKRDLPSGSALTESDFQSVALGLEASGLETPGVYLSGLQPNLTLKTALRRGELLPYSAIGPVDERHAVVLTPSQTLSTSIRVGSLVDVWFVARAGAAGSGAEAVPLRVGTALEVLSLVRPDAGSAFASDELRLEVAVLPSELAALMLASASGGFIGVVSNR